MDPEIKRLCKLLKAMTPVDRAAVIAPVVDRATARALVEMPKARPAVDAVLRAEARRMDAEVKEQQRRRDERRAKRHEEARRMGFRPWWEV